MPRRYPYQPCKHQRAKRILAPWWTDYDDARLREIERARKTEKMR